MKSGRKIRALLLLGALMASAFAFMPAQAAGAQTCQVAGTVSLAGYENLITVDGGSGTVSGQVVCEGTVASGVFGLSGSFKFCKHFTSNNHNQPPNTTNPCTGTSASPPQQLNSTEENLFNVLGSNTPIIAHVVASMSFTGAGGTGCSFSLNGHTIGVVAHLDLLSYTCGTATATSARAEATSAPVIIPGGIVVDCTPGPAPGAKACFKDLVIAGTIVAQFP